MLIKDPEQIYHILFTPDERLALRTTYDILLSVMNKFSANEEIVALEDGATIGILELSRTLGILDGLMNAIETAEVVEERKSATLQICEHHEDWGDYPRPYYLYHCSSCFESVKQDYPNENFKFCPHCGAQYGVKFVKEK